MVSEDTGWKLTKKWIKEYLKFGIVMNPKNIIPRFLLQNTKIRISLKGVTAMLGS